MKTITEHLELIKDKKVKYNALRNLLEINKNDKRLLMSEAILDAFTWETTPEGYDYWNNIYEQSQGGINKLTNLTPTK